MRFGTGFGGSQRGFEKFDKVSKFHFGVTKKDPGLLFYFHVLNLFKCWSKLGLTNI